MSLQNYNQLQATLARWIKRADLTAVIPDFIELAEADMVRRIIASGNDHIPQKMIKRTVIQLTSDNIDAPDDFLGGRAFYREGAPHPIEYASPEKIGERNVLYPDVEGDPQLYTVLNNSIKLWPKPTGTDVAFLIYTKRPPALSADNPYNWILQDNPDAYLYGSLLQAVAYMIGDPRLPTFQDLYNQAIATICGADLLGQKAPRP